MITLEDNKFLTNCYCAFKFYDMYNIIREYRHSYNANTDEYMQLQNLINDFHSNYLNLDIEQFRKYILDVLDFILDNKLKEFSSKDNRYRVWNSIYDCVREVYFGENM